MLNSFYPGNWNAIAWDLASVLCERGEKHNALSRGCHPNLTPGTLSGKGYSLLCHPLNGTCSSSFLMARRPVLTLWRKVSYLYSWSTLPSAVVAVLLRGLPPEQRRNESCWQWAFKAQHEKGYHRRLHSGIRLWQNFEGGGKGGG